MTDKIILSVGVKLDSQTFDIEEIEIVDEIHFVESTIDLKKLSVFNQNAHLFFSIRSVEEDKKEV